MSTTPQLLTRAGIRNLARRDHAQYSQYDGAWDGDEWRLVWLRRNVVTKMGEAFRQGDISIARKERHDGRVSVMAYSVRNRINTAVPENAIRWLEDEPTEIYTWAHHHKCPRCGEPRDCDSTDCSSRECDTCAADAERRERGPQLSPAPTGYELAYQELRRFTELVRGFFIYDSAGHAVYLREQAEQALHRADAAVRAVDEH